MNVYQILLNKLKDKIFLNKQKEVLIFGKLIYFWRYEKIKFLKEILLVYSLNKEVLTKEQLGTIELKPDCAFVAIPLTLAEDLVEKLNNTRLKKKKVRVTNYKFMSEERINI